MIWLKTHVLYYEYGKNSEIFFQLFTRYFYF